MLSESEVQSERCQAHQKEDISERMDTRKMQERPKKAPSRRRNTHNRYQTISVLENIREEDEAEEPIYVFDNGKWLRETVVDSSAAECVTNKKRMPLF